MIFFVFAIFGDCVCHQHVSGEREKKELYMHIRVLLISMHMNTNLDDSEWETEREGGRKSIEKNEPFFRLDPSHRINLYAIKFCFRWFCFILYAKVLVLLSLSISLFQIYFLASFTCSSHHVITHNKSDTKRYPLALSLFLSML